jgi:uncharacterized membrane protein
MKSLIIGILILAFAVFAVLPPETFGLGWLNEMLAFIKGGVPILALLIGLVAVFIGIADIKDRAEAKKEEAAAKD